MKLPALLFIISLAISCGNKKSERENTEKQAHELAKQDSTNADSLKTPDRPEGWKSPHQEHMEQHKKKKSNIK